MPKIDMSNFNAPCNNILSEKVVKMPEVKKEYKKNGRPPIENKNLKLSKKVNLLLLPEEKEYLDKIKRDLGIPASVFIRKKLLEVGFFKK